MSEEASPSAELAAAHALKTADTERLLSLTEIIATERRATLGLNAEIDRLRAELQDARHDIQTLTAALELHHP